jgi:hypothetical protein
MLGILYRETKIDAITINSSKTFKDLKVPVARIQENS